MTAPKKGSERWHRVAKQKKARRLERVYGITTAQYSAMLQTQGEACAICGTKTPRGAGDFHIDHCHSTGKVRGLLCNCCNTGIGQFKDNPAALREAAAYLEGHAQ